MKESYFCLPDMGLSCMESISMFYWNSTCSFWVMSMSRFFFTELVLAIEAVPGLTLVLLLLREPLFTLFLLLLPPS